MGDTLKAGDYVLVNKLKSKNNPDRNCLVLYKSPLRRDASKPPIFAGRCIGIPGDVVRMGTDGFRVNGRLLPNAPMMQPTFRINKNIKESLLNTMDALRIPLRNIKEDSVSIILRMSLREKELLIRNLSKVVPMEMIGEHAMEYEFVIPRKGKTIDVNEISLMVGKEAIMNEAGDAAVIRDGKLYIYGEGRSTFSFGKDYFWILSENETDGIDSRHLGLIPQDHIIGNIWYCWYSKNPSSRFKKIR
jgi:signal peptidase I